MCRVLAVHSAEELNALKERLLDRRVQGIRDRQATIEDFRRILTERVASLQHTLALLEALQAETDRSAGGAPGAAVQLADTDPGS